MRNIPWTRVVDLRDDVRSGDLSLTSFLVPAVDPCFGPVAPAEVAGVGRPRAGKLRGACASCANRPPYPPAFGSSAAANPSYAMSRSGSRLTISSAL